MQQGTHTGEMQGGAGERKRALGWNGGMQKSNVGLQKARKAQ